MSDFDYPITVTVFAWEQYEDGEGPPEKVVDVIAWLSTVLDGIPAEYRNNATFEIDSETSWDQSLAKLEISYERPPTPAEIQARRTESEMRARSDLEHAKRMVAVEERRLADLQKRSES